MGDKQPLQRVVGSNLDRPVRSLSQQRRGNPGRRGEICPLTSVLRVNWVRQGCPEGWGGACHLLFLPTQFFKCAAGKHTSILSTTPLNWKLWYSNEILLKLLTWNKGIKNIKSSQVNVKRRKELLLKCYRAGPTCVHWINWHIIRLMRNQSPTLFNSNRNWTWMHSAFPVE